MTVIHSPSVGAPPVVTSLHSNSHSGSVENTKESGSSVETRQNGSNTTTADSTNAELLSPSDKQLISQLEAADQRVKSHEMAHLLAAGGYARGGPSYQYRQGPDGKKYAVAGEVQIDSGKESSPARTIAKMKTVQKAALAPTDPSAQDRKVAATASRNIAAASQEIRLEEAVKVREASEPDVAEKDKLKTLTGSGEVSNNDDFSGESPGEQGVLGSSRASQKGLTAYASNGRSSLHSPTLSLFA